MESMDKDLVYLWKQISQVVRKSKNAIIGLIAELEIKVDKLALKVLPSQVLCPVLMQIPIKNWGWVCIFAMMFALYAGFFYVVR